jgi:hypothetical protein
MRVFVLTAAFVLVGVFAVQANEVHRSCERTTISNTYITNNMETDDQYRKFRAYVGGDLRFLELSDNIGLEAQYRFSPEWDNAKEEHRVGLVAKFDITGGEKK